MQRESTAHLKIGESNQQNNNPYRKQMITVKKIECNNHLLRNLCKKLQTVAVTIQSKMQKKHGFIEIRNIVKNNILKIRKEVILAISLRKKEQQPYKATELRFDIEHF